MADDVKKNVPRASKSHIAAVRRTAKEAADELDREQEGAVMGLAEALNEIGEGEALAHIDGRIAFIERQVERLQARKEEADRGLQGELSVMRARIEDALAAVGGTAEEQKESGVALERRLTALVAESERRAADVVDALRRDIVSQVEQASARLEKAEARLRGETKALSGGVEEQVRAISESVAQTQEEIHAIAEALTEQVDAAADEVEKLVDETTSRIRDTTDSTIKQAASEQESRFQELSNAINERVEKARESLDDGIATISADQRTALDQMTQDTKAATVDLRDKFEALEARIDQKFVEEAERAANSIVQTEDLSRNVTERIGLVEQLLIHKSDEIEGMVNEKHEVVLDVLNNRSANLEASVGENLAEHKSDIEGRLGELRAEIRLESQRLREHADGQMASATDRFEEINNETLVRLREGEESLTNSIIRLEQAMDHHGRRMVSGESEWSDIAGSLNQEVSDLKIRLEELVGRVASSEARRATERGSSQVAVEALTARLDVIERRVREAVEETSAKNATRLEMLTSQVERLKASENEGEEQSAAIEFLSRRVGEMTEKLDEALTKVNALGKFVTKKAGLVEGKDSLVLPSDVIGRVEEVEARIAGLAKTKQPSDVSSDRLESLEKKVSELVDVVRRLSSEPAHLAKKIAELEASKDQSLQIGELLERLERIEKQLAHPTAPPEILERLDRAERALAQPRPISPQAAPDIEARIDSLERVISSLSATISNRQAQLIARMDEIEQSSASPSTNILPQRKKGRW